MIQNIKKICTDSSSDETTPRRQQQGIIYRATDILDPAFKLPFKYGWKRELVSYFHIFITKLYKQCTILCRCCEPSRQ